MREKIKEFITSILQEVLEKELKKVDITLEKKILSAPFAYSFMDGIPIKKGAGYYVYMGKFFASEEEVTKYRKVKELPDDSTKIIDGEPLKFFRNK